MNPAPPAPSRWSRWGFPLAALLAYLAMLLWMNRAFLPDATRFVYDIRFMVWTNDDKINELMGWCAGRMGGMWAGLRHLGQGDQELPFRLNLLPLLLLRVFLGLAPPVLAYNLLLWLGAALAGLTTCLLARRLCRDDLASWVAGALVLAAPFTRNLWANASLDYALFFWVPLLLWLLLRLGEGGDQGRGWRGWGGSGGWGDALAVGLVLAALGGTSWYHLLAAIPPVAGLVLLTALRGAPWRRVLRQIVGLSLGSLLLVPALMVEVPAIHQMRLDGALPGQQALPQGGLPLQDVLAELSMAPWLWGVLPLVVLGLAAAGRRWEKLWLTVVACLWTAWALDFMMGSPLTCPLLARSDLLWRMRRLDYTLVVPIVSLSVVAAAGIAGLARWSRWRWLGRGLSVAASAVVLWVPLGAFQPLRGAPFNLNEAMLQRLARDPGRPLIALDTEENKHFQRLMEFSLAVWTSRPVLGAGQPLGREVRRAVLAQGAGAADGPNGLDLPPLAVNSAQVPFSGGTAWVARSLQEGCYTVLLHLPEHTDGRAPSQAASPDSSPAPLDTLTALGLEAESFDGFIVTTAPCSP